MTNVKNETGIYKKKGIYRKKDIYIDLIDTKKR